MSITALGWQGFTASLVSIRQGCGNDGGHYCAMVGHSPEPNFPNTPYSQRVLLPFLVKIIFNPKNIEETINGFAFLNFLIIAITATLIFIFIKNNSVSNSYTLPLIGSFMYLLHPFIFRLTLSYPVLIDQLSNLFIITSLILVSKKNTFKQFLALSIIFPLTLTRLHTGYILSIVLIILINKIKLKN